MARLRSNVNFGNRPGRPPAPLKSRYVVNALRLLVEDVERSIEVVHEESPAARLVAQEVHPGELRHRVLSVWLGGDRHLRVIRQLQRQARPRLREKGRPNRKRQRHNPNRFDPCGFRPGAAHGRFVSNPQLAEVRARSSYLDWPRRARRPARARQAPIETLRFVSLPLSAPSPVVDSLLPWW